VHAWDIHDVVVRTHKAVTHAVEVRLTYIRRFKGKKALTGEEQVAEYLVYSRFLDIHAADRNTNGTDRLLAAKEDNASKLVSTWPQKLKPLKLVSNRRPAKETEATPTDLPRGRTRT
jgi:hypothetical protein